MLYNKVYAIEIKPLHVWENK